MTAGLPILYSFRRCPYAMRARMAVVASGETCVLREVVLRDKPAEMLAASPKGTVPVLVLPENRVIDESYAIMKWLLGRNDPDAWLVPSAGSLADIDNLVATNDGAFKQHLDRYKYPSRYDGVDPMHHRAEGLRILRQLDGRLADHAYLFGPRFSLADAAIAPFVRQFANTDRDWFDDQDIPDLHRWLNDILGAPVFTRVMDKYDQWRPGDDVRIFPDERD